MLRAVSLNSSIGLIGSIVLGLVLAGCDRSSPESQRVLAEKAEQLARYEALTDADIERIVDLRARLMDYCKNLDDLQGRLWIIRNGGTDATLSTLRRYGTQRDRDQYVGNLKLQRDAMSYAVRQTLGELKDLDPGYDTQRLDQDLLNRFGEGAVLTMDQAMRECSYEQGEAAFQKLMQ